MDYWHRLRQLAGKQTLIVPGAAGAIVHDGKVLLVRHGLLKKWQVPGGVQEVGESIQQTVEREIREELGLNLKAGPLIAVYSGPEWTLEYPDGSRLQQLLLFFMMEGPLLPIRAQETELTAHRFFAPNDVPEDTMACCKQKVRDALAYTGKVILR
ncbi:MAG: NUDIX domain-containing protein [Chloroflexi bacterium]|nr:NUDIX domain-containing protein [Chloroflexota bacterium]